MVDATATNLGGTTTTNPTDKSSSTQPSTSFSCTSCQVHFQDSQQQRTHMKTSWHTYNAKRKVAELPPISLPTFESQIEQKVAKSSSVSSSSDESSSDDESMRSASPFECLFCCEDFRTDDEGLKDNLEHMMSAHGFTIPDAEGVYDIQTFVEYLSTEVRTWHECLYCGATKPTTESIQAHMRDKGHCQINIDREPELLDFWDRDSDGSGTDAPQKNEKDGEIRFASGKVIGSKATAASTKKVSRKRRIKAANLKSLPAASTDEESAADETHSADDDAERPSALIAQTHAAGSRRTTRNAKEDMSIAGITPQQRQALALAEKKAQRSEAVARRAREWMYARNANSQEFDQLNEGKRKWGKQNHKMLPR